MAESGESGDNIKIDARKAQQSTITQVVDKRKSSNPILNVIKTKMKLGLPVKLGITAAAVSFMSGFACGYITAVMQEAFIKNVVQNLVQRALDDSKVMDNVVRKALEESEVQLIRSVVEKVLQENKVTEENVVGKKK